MGFFSAVKKFFTGGSSEKKQEKPVEEVKVEAVAKAEESKVLGIVEGMYKYFKAHPEKLGDEYKAILETDGIDRAICDYIAGMTDHYAVTVYSNIYIPKGWSI